jgi:hypothetical protein
MGHRETQGKHVTTKAEIKVMFVQANEHQGLPTNHQELGEWHRTHSPSQPPKGANPDNTCMSDFLLPEL